MLVNHLTFLNRKIVAPIHNKTITTVVCTHQKTSKIINNTVKAVINSTITVEEEVEVDSSNVVEVKTTINNADHTRVSTAPKTLLNKTQCLCRNQFRISIKDLMPKFRKLRPSPCLGQILQFQFLNRCLPRFQFPFKIYHKAISIILEVYRLHKKESNMSAIDFSQLFRLELVLNKLQKSLE